MQKIGVIGGGAWGTALAVTAARAGREVLLWARDADVVDAINAGHENPLFLPDIALDPAILATASLTEMADRDALLVAVPSQFLRRVVRSLAPLAPEIPLVLCAKGIETGTGFLMSEGAKAERPEAPIAALSGPTFAAEVARGLPTALTLAIEDDSSGLGGPLAHALSTPSFRIYLTDDLIGVEVGGAAKNVIAIACGIAEGRGLGANARAALITRGLAEITRFGLARGARAETFMGLAGIGDLTLTCTSPQSRNMSFGIALGQGTAPEAYLSGRRAVVEGIANAASVTASARRLGVDMPIAQAVDGILHHGLSIDDAVGGLLGRPLRAEPASMEEAVLPKPGAADGC